MRRTIGPLVVAVVTALCLLSLPVVAGGTPATRPEPVRHGVGPFTGAFNVMTARTVRSHLGQVAEKGP
jgi:hypothetical protein